MSTNVTALCFQWTTARKKLSQALDAYRLACNSLSALGVQAGTIIESAQPDFLLTVEADLPLLEREAISIAQSSDALRKLRNGSPKLVPINHLPPELLAFIFSIAVDTSRANPPPCAYPKGRADFLNVLSSVGSYWRHVSLATPALWAAFTLTDPEGLNHATLWLERSRPCPLRILSQSRIYHRYEKDLAEMVGRHSSRFKSLVLRLDYKVGHKIFYDACVHHTEDSVFLESLALNEDPFSLKNARVEVKWPPKDLMDKYLKSVHTLYLRCRPFGDWSSAAFQDLTRLYLGLIPPKFLPTCEELLNVLRASPRLRSLELSSLKIQNVPRNDATPVNLESLEILWLQYLSCRLAQWLLESIIPHSDGLTLTLSDIWSSNQRSIGYNLPFSIPDRVRVLYIHSEGNPALDIDLPGLLKSLTRLETLALKSFRIGLIDSTPHPSDGRNPMLAALDLVSCSVIDTATFKSMLVRHSIRQLNLFECEGCPTSDELLEASPGLVISDTPGDFLTMFSPFQ